MLVAGIVLKTKTKICSPKSTNNMSVYYQELWDLRDKRVDNWPMINSPWPTISLCVGYIYLAVVLGKLKLYLMFKVELVKE